MPTRESSLPQVLEHYGFHAAWRISDSLPDSAESITLADATNQHIRMNNEIHYIRKWVLLHLDQDIEHRAIRGLFVLMGSIGKTAGRCMTGLYHPMVS